MEKFYKADLHIHTPASSCYKGPKDDVEYLKILKVALKKSLKMIAITDHNSIDGYKKLISIKRDLMKQKENLTKITDSTQAKSEIKLINKELALFERLLILPGIEIEVRPGVHLLVIFDDKVKIEKIDSFLISGGYEKECHGLEDPSINPNWDILNLFEESIKYECLIIDAHTDSNKGILNSTQPGTYRANCFRSNELVAVCYKSEEQKDKLNNTIISSQSYKRDIPLSFVKFSDAHKCDEIGTNLTWIKMEKVNFDHLKIAFSNPTENITVEEPSINEILGKVLKSKNSYGISDLSEKNKKKIAQYICALNNSTGGFVLIGVTSNKNKRGISYDHETPEDRKNMRKEIASLMDLMDLSAAKDFSLTISNYPLQNKKTIFSLHVKKNENIAFLKKDGYIYSLKNRNLLTLNALELQSLIEIRNSKQIEDKINQRILRIEKECYLIKDSFQSLSIIREFEKKAISIREFIDLELNEGEDLPEGVEIKEGNGASKGNISFLTPPISPRYPYAYLRYSLPLFIIKNFQNKTTKKETIYIVRGGGVFYANQNYPIAKNNEFYTLKVKSNSPKSYSNKFIACFLKSSFCIWYCRNKLDDINIHDPKVLMNILLPKINRKIDKTDKLILSIENSFDNIVKTEKKFLIEKGKIRDEEKAMDLIEKHNSTIDPLAYEIDNMIYDIMELSQDYRATIEDNLRANDIYLPDIKVN